MIVSNNGKGARSAKPRPSAEATPRVPATVSPARRAAVEVLSRVSRRQGHSDDLLHGPLLAGLSQEDRNLTTTLVLGVLRWQIALDARIAPLLTRPDIRPADEVMLALRLGAFQLLHLDRIPAHAAINESVELVRVAGHPHAAGMVNAILRKLNGAPLQRKPLHESAAAFAERLGHPSWLVERWIRAYGRDAAAAICEFDQAEPACGELFSVDGSSTLPVMDDGSRLVAELAAASAPNAKRIWDCCAAPGGKTLVLANRHADAELVATDSNAKRLRRLADRLVAVAPDANIKTLLADASATSAVSGEFDLVLCDVPCSGTGTLARNPEIRHQLQPSEIGRQAKRQKEILANALQHLSESGRLVYSTCSLEPEECEDVVAAVLAKHQQFAVSTLEPTMDALQANGILAQDADLSSSFREGTLRTLPGFTLQADGFFAAAIARR